MNCAAIILLSITFIYIIFRAYFLSITHDEALTIITQASQPYHNILLYTEGIYSNNHLINTLLIRFLISIFGYNELIIRLPGLMGGVLFIFGAYKLCQRLFPKPLLFTLSLSLLILNPYVLDFLSLARGYSLALGLLILSLFFFFNSYKCTEPKEALKYKIISYLIMSLSVIANFSFLNVYLALIGSYFIIEVIALYFSLEEKPSLKVSFNYFKKCLLYIIIITLCLFALILLPLSKIAQEKYLYAGKDGFWSDTVSSLIQSSLYGKEYFNINFVYCYTIFAQILFINILLLVILFALFYNKAPLNSTDKELIIISSIISLTTLSIIFQNILFGTPFVMGRTAIYFIPLFTIFVFILWKSIINNETLKFRIIPHVALTVCGVMILSHYVSCVNLSHTFDWKYDAAAKAAIHDIMVMEKDLKSKNGQITIGATWWLSPAMNYYLLSHGSQYQLVDRNGPDGIFDYYYVYKDDKDILIKRNVDIINHYDISNTLLGVSGQHKLTRNNN